MAKVINNAKELFQAYQAAEDKLNEAERVREECFDARSATVKAIHAAMGAGPFQWNGKTMKITKRDTKDENDNVVGTSWFFRSIGDEVQKID